MDRKGYQSHPDKYLGVYAYWNVEQPPRNRKKLPDNVIVALTLDILQHYDADYRAKDRLLVKAWSGYANRLHTYVYYGLGWFTPRMSPRLAAEDLRFCVRTRRGPREQKHIIGYLRSRRPACLAFIPDQLSVRT